MNDDLIIDLADKHCGAVTSLDNTIEYAFNTEEIIHFVNVVLKAYCYIKNYSQEEL